MKDINNYIYIFKTKKTQRKQRGKIEKINNQVILILNL